MKHMRQKIVRGRSGRCLQGHSFFHTQHNWSRLNSQRMWQPAQNLKKFKPDKILGWRMRSRLEVLPLPKKLCAIHTCWEGEISFLWWSVACYSNHSSGETLCSVLGNKEQAPCLFVYVLFVFVFVIFIIFKSFSSSSSSEKEIKRWRKREIERKHEVEWVERKRGVGRSWSDRGERRWLKYQIEINF